MIENFIEFSKMDPRLSLQARSFLMCNERSTIITTTKIFFHFVHVVSTYSQRSTLSKNAMCSSHFTLMKVDNSLCFQLSFHGFLNWISINAFECVNFFFPLFLVFDEPPFFIMDDKYICIELKNSKSLNTFVLVLFFFHWKQLNEEMM